MVMIMICCVYACVILFDERRDVRMNDHKPLIAAAFVRKLQLNNLVRYRIHNVGRQSRRIIAVVVVGTALI